MSLFSASSRVALIGTNEQIAKYAEVWVNSGGASSKKN